MTAGPHRLPLRIGTARRVIGGTLMASGAAAAAFFALLTAWVGTEILGEIVRSELIDVGEAQVMLKLTASGALATGICTILAWFGHLILGPRPPV